MTASTRDSALKAAYREGVGRQAQIGLGFTTAGWEPEQVGDGGCRVRGGVIGWKGAVRVMQVGEARQIEQDETELERAPGVVFWGVKILKLLVLATSHRRGIEGM